MFRPIRAVLAALELLRLAALSRFRLRGVYWSWRMHTAFGPNPPPRGAAIREALRFGDWARRMRHLGRS